MAFEVPDETDFKDFFTRDFVYGSDTSTVMDADITKAILMAGINFNQALWATQEVFNVGYLFLAAHFLVMNLRASSQGLSGQYPWLAVGKSVGNVNESYQIPERIMANPEFAMLTKTNYGAEYLFLILPQLTGQIFIVDGGVQP